MSGHRSSCLLAVLAVLPLGARAQVPRIRDSAGVRITENGMRSTAPIAFTIAAMPSFDIGGLKGNPDDELDTYLRNYSNPVARLSTGGQVVGDRVRLRYFDAAGKQTNVVGREGQGPREFQQTSAICQTRGDTIVLSDRVNARVSIWDKSGVFVREFSVGAQGVPRSGCFDDGTFLLQSWTTGPAGSGSMLRLERWRLDGSRVAELGAFGGGPALNYYLTAQASVAAHGDRFYAGDPRAHEVKAYNVDGKLIAIVRTSDPIAAVTAAEADALRSPSAAGSAGGGGRTTSQPDARPKPTHWPAYAAIRTDDAGRLWVEEYHKASRDPHVWTAFDKEGRMLGKFRIDAQASYGDPFVLGFVGDGVIIHNEDKDGAPHVATYRLVAPRG